MTQRMYLVVLDDNDGKANFNWFEDELLGYSVGRWKNLGYAAVDHTQLTVTAEDADEDYPEGSEVDGGDILSDVDTTLEILQEEIRKQKEQK